MPIQRPMDEADLADLIADAGAHGRRLELRGGGSKGEVGAPDRAAEPVDLRGLAGVVDYDPTELVLTVRPGATLAEVQALVDGEGQALAFEPFDHGPLFGRAAEAATMGGVMAAGVAGSGRLGGGAARDHLLGFRAVSGRGERFVAGGKVVKNVTGYDLPKLAAGSWGRLFALTELTLKVLPRPRERVTRLLFGHTPEEAFRVMAAALGSQAAVTAAAYLPEGLNGGRPVTALRLEGVAPSIAARLAVLDALSGGIGRGEDAGPEDAEAVWLALRTLSPLDGRTLWRIGAPARAGAALLARFQREGATALLDWGGSLVWLGYEGDPARLRTAVTNAGGHATLLRGPAELRVRLPAFHPQPAPLAALEARVRRAFDPAGVFETGRFDAASPAAAPLREAVGAH